MAQVDICIYPAAHSLSAAEESKYAAPNRYTTMVTMEAGEDGTGWATAGNNPYCEIIGGGGNWAGNPDTDRVDFNGWELDTASALVITTIESARSSDGSYDTNAYILQENGDYCLYLDSDSFHGLFDGIQFNIVSDSAIMLWPRRIAHVDIKNCFFENGGSDVGFYYDEIAGSKIVRCWNTVFNGGNYGVRILDDTASFWHCTINNCSASGIRTANTSGSIINTLVFNTANDFNGSCTIDYCATDDNDGTNGQDLGNSATSWNLTVTDYANGDFTVKAATTTCLIYNNGTTLTSAFTDLSGDATPLETDIAGYTRNTWDIGAFELQAGAPAVNVAPLWYYHNRMRQ